MKRLAVLGLMTLSVAVALAPPASARGWTRCADSVTVKGIDCPAAHRFAHEYLDDYYYVSPIPNRVPGGFTCSGEMLDVGRFEHLSCTRVRGGVHQRVRFFFRGKRLGGPRGYWTSCGIRSRAHGPACAEARQIALEFVRRYEEGGDYSPYIGKDVYYCTVQWSRVRYGPIYCVADVGYEHESTFTEWKILYSFEELGRR